MKHLAPEHTARVVGRVHALTNETRISQTLIVRRRAATAVTYSIADLHLHEWYWSLAGAHRSTKST